jgi:hypothetical protein
MRTCTRAPRGPTSFFRATGGVFIEDHPEHFEVYERQFRFK